MSKQTEVSKAATRKEQDEDSHLDNGTPGPVHLPKAMLTFTG